MVGHGMCAPARQGLVRHGLPGRDTLSESRGFPSPGAAAGAASGGSPTRGAPAWEAVRAAMLEVRVAGCRAHSEALRRGGIMIAARLAPTLRGSATPDRPGPARTGKF